MIVKLPLASCVEILKAKSEVLSFIASRSEFTVNEVVAATHAGKKGVRRLVKRLVKAGCVEKDGKAYRWVIPVQDGNFIVNLRDYKTEALFRNRKMRDVLLSLFFGETSVMKMALDVGSSYRQTKRMLQSLRRIGLIKGLELNPQLIFEPENPLDLIPRHEHRTMVKEFLDLVSSKAPDIPLIFFGDASWGRPTTKLEFMLLVHAVAPPEEINNVIQQHVLAARGLESSHNCRVELAVAWTTVWLEQKLGMTLTENPLMKEATRGICLRGKVPGKDDYFQLHFMEQPLPESRLKELLKKQYLAYNGFRYVYTDKAIRTMRRKAPTLIKEARIPVLDRSITLLTIEKPGTELNQLL